jgi:3-methyladenine DNA glycosylase AlkC
MAAESSTSEVGVFKEWFNSAVYREIADRFAAASSEFDRERFLQLTLEGLDDRELMDRLRQTSVAVQASLPGDYAAQLEVMYQVARPEENGLVGCWYSDFVGQFGIEHPELSLPALAQFTQYGSAEFAIRGFLLRAPEDTLAVMHDWAKHDNEHVRRLASEGSRTRLPWGKRLDFLITDPTLTRGILETLRNDPSLYVRKSVANHLNDLTKDNPDYVLELVAGWDRSSPRTAWIVKHALRTLIKQAHPVALELMGVGQKARLTEVSLALSPATLRLGETVTLQLELRSGAKQSQELLIDYIVHYVKASGRSQPKVFKWKQVALAAGDGLSLKKKQTIKDFTTRRHYPGVHRVEVQINGQCLAESSFVLR